MDQGEIVKSRTVDLGQRILKTSDLKMTGKFIQLIAHRFGTPDSGNQI